MYHYLKDISNYDFRLRDISSIVGSGNLTYTNSDFNPSGIDKLTSDIGAMIFNEELWKAGILLNLVLSTYV